MSDQGTYQNMNNVDASNLKCSDNFKDYHLKGCSTNNKLIAKCFQLMLRLYIIMQYLIFISSTAVIIFLRCYYDAFIEEIAISWASEEKTCYKRFTMQAGVMYAITTLGIAQFFVFKDTLKKLTAETKPVRAHLKYFIEVVSIIFFLLNILTVGIFGIFDNCPDSKGEIGKARILTAMAVLLLLENGGSFGLFLYLKFVVKKCEKTRLYYDNFLKS